MAVESPQRLSDDPERARQLLELVTEMPTPVWGRDELRTGEGRAMHTLYLLRHANRLFFTKNVEWSSESEYRFVVRTPDLSPVFVDVSKSLQGLRLGPETPEQYFPALRELL